MRVLTRARSLMCDMTSKLHEDRPDERGWIDCSSAGTSVPQVSNFVRASAEAIPRPVMHSYETGL